MLTAASNQHNRDVQHNTVARAGEECWGQSCVFGNSASWSAGTAVLLADAVAWAQGQGVTLDAMLVVAAAPKLVPSTQRKTLLPSQHVYKQQCCKARSNNVAPTNYNATQFSRGGKPILSGLPASKLYDRIWTYLFALFICTARTAMLLHDPSRQSGSTASSPHLRLRGCHSGHQPQDYDWLSQYIPLKTGFVRQMLAPYSSYSAFVWQA